jgi:SprB repeat
MRHYIFIYFCLFINSISSYSQQFQLEISGSGRESLIDVLEEADGSIVAVGYTSSSGAGLTDGLLIKFNAVGEIIWQKTYGGSGSDRFYNFIKGNDGGYFMIGDTESTGNGGQDVWIVKTDALGNVEWSKTFGGNLNDNGPLFATLLNAPDGYIVSGVELSTHGNGSTTGTFIIRVNESGDFVWAKNYHSTLEQTFLAATYIEGDILYASGSHDLDGCLAKFDLNTGNFISAKGYGTSFNEAAYTLHHTSDGHFVLSDGTWAINEGTKNSCWIMKVTKGGDIIWSTAISSVTGSIRGAATPTDDGGYIISPLSNETNSNIDATLIKISADGNLEWINAYGNNNAQTLYRSQLFSDGNLVSVGKTYDDNNVEHAILLKNPVSPINEESCCGRTINNYVQSNFTPTVSERFLVEVPPFIESDWNITANNAQLNIEETCESVTDPIINVSAATCSAQGTGQISIEGPPGQTYSINGGNFAQVSSFDQLTASTYNIIAKSISGCSQAYEVVIPYIGIDLADLDTINRLNCTTLSDIELVNLSGTPPFQYKLQDGEWGDISLLNDVSADVELVFIRDSTGCIDTIPISIPVYMQISITDQDIQKLTCTQPEGSISIQVAGGEAPYSFSMNDSISQTDGRFIISSPGYYQIVVTDQVGCSTTTSLIEFDSFLTSQEVQINFDICSSTAFSLPNGDKITQSGKYNITFQNSNGCDSLVTYDINVSSEELYIPNVIALDDTDGNDRFTVFGSPACIEKILYLRVFDRWGALSFERFNFSPNEAGLGWDGYINGKRGSLGVYAYDCKIRLSNGQVIKKIGDLTLLDSK